MARSKVIFTPKVTHQKISAEKKKKAREEAGIKTNKEKRADSMKVMVDDALEFRLKIIKQMSEFQGKRMSSVILAYAMVTAQLSQKIEEADIESFITMCRSAWASAKILTDSAPPAEQEQKTPET